VPVLQFLDIKCKVLHSASISWLRLQKATSRSSSGPKSAAVGEMLTRNNNRFSSLDLSACGTPLRSGQTIRRETECCEVVSKPSWFEYDETGYLIALAMICNPM